MNRGIILVGLFCTCALSIANRAAASGQALPTATLPTATSPTATPEVAAWDAAAPGNAEPAAEPVRANEHVVVGASPTRGVPLRRRLVAANAASDSEPTATGEGTERGALAPDEPSHLVLGGYVEAYYQWNFNDPTNDVTNYRGFDNRHNSFTLSNVALDAQWDDERLIGRLTLQVGHTPSTYYLSEPSASGASGANDSNAELWKYVQQAYGGYRFGQGGEFSVAAGLFLSPTGPESMSIRDNWHWSHSNLFFGLPFYHTGVRARYGFDEHWGVTLAGYNGWNSVVDNNAEKTVSVEATYTSPELAAAFVYLGGVERPRGAAEGRAFRHLFDAHATWTVTEWLAVRSHVDAGFEPNVFGVSRWAAAELSGRFRIEKRWFFALRGDVFGEHVGRNGDGQAAALFWPASWVSSATGTLDFRPHQRVSFRLEYRHDQAGAEMFFGRRAPRDEETGRYVPSWRSQNTVTAGLTSWF